MGEENNNYCVLTYVEQAIPNPLDLPSFKLEIINIDNSDKLHQCMICDVSPCPSTTKIDITGMRVINYIRVHNIASIIKETVIPLLTGYNKTTNEYKSWKN